MLRKNMYSDKYSDLTLICEKQHLKVHKIILCTQSPVFAAACDGSFQEATTNIINIEEFDCETVKRMLTFLYNDPKDYVVEIDEQTPEPDADFPDAEVLRYMSPLQGKSSDRLVPYASCPPTPNFATSNTLIKHISVAAIADYYDISPLKALANSKIEKILQTEWSSHGFSSVIDEVYSSTSDKNLHQIITSTTVDHLDTLSQELSLLTPELMSAFALSVIQETGRRHALLATELSTCAFELEQAHRREHLMKDGLADCISCLGKVTNCRSCHEDFGAYIDPGYNLEGPSYLIRCRRCNARHYPDD